MVTKRTIMCEVLDLRLKFADGPLGERSNGRKPQKGTKREGEK